MMRATLIAEYSPQLDQDSLQFINRNHEMINVHDDLSHLTQIDHALDSLADPMRNVLYQQRIQRLHS